jgi:hypothetical protein
MINNNDLNRAKFAIQGYRKLIQDNFDKSNHLMNSFRNTDLFDSYQKFVDDRFYRADKVLQLFKIKKLFAPDIFRIVGFYADENNFSDAISYLLDPNANHGLGTQTLKSVLNRIKQKSPAIINQILKSLNHKSHSIVVHRERSEISTRPDIEILCDDFIIIVENKMRGGEETFRNDEWQTNRQYDVLRKRANSIGAHSAFLAIFLSPEGKPAKNKNFIPISVNHLIGSLKTVIHPKNTTSDLRSITAFLDYYCFE